LVHFSCAPLLSLSFALCLLGQHIRNNKWWLLLLSFCLYFMRRKNAGWGLFENKVSRKKFEITKEEVKRGMETLHNEKRYHLYSSLNIIRVIKSRTMTWVGLVARMGEKINVYRIFGKKTWRLETLHG
jgi:uncharacterized membrane protein YbhN (UPF0104 family)